MRGSFEEEEGCWVAEKMGLGQTFGVADWGGGVFFLPVSSIFEAVSRAR